MKSKPSTGSAIVSRILSRTHKALNLQDDGFSDERYIKLNRRWSSTGKSRKSLIQRILVLNMLVMALIVFSAFNAIDYTEELISGELKKITNETSILANSYMALNAITEDEEQKASFLRANMGATDSYIILFDKDGQANYKPDQSISVTIDQTQNIPSYIRLINLLFNKSKFIPTVRMPDTVDGLAELPFSFKLNREVPDIRIFRTPDKVMKVIVFRPLYSAEGTFIGNMVVLYNKMHVENMLMKLRANMFNSVLVSLVFITLLSFFLAAYIGHPLRRLALAAEAIRQGEGKYQDIPNFSDRKDEISVLSETLQAMTAELVERLDSIDSFAADVAHELKNPLTSIRSAVETSVKIKDKKKQEKLLAIIMHDLDRMDRLITDISRASRLDTELLRERLEPIDLNNIIQDTVDYIEQFLDRKSNQAHAPIVIMNKKTELPPIVLANTTRIMQVFENVISNALSFSPVDRPIEISVNVNEDLRYVEVQVRDYGSGIPEGNLDRIFERFYTERREQDLFGMHSGLGLSICRQIVDAHRGQIAAQNHEDGGAIFTVILPLYDNA